MDLINYDFEGGLEPGFKNLFAAAGIKILIDDDLPKGDLPDERILLEVNAGEVISEDHVNAANEYDNYNGTIDVEIQTLRVTGDKVPLSAGFKSRHAELRAKVRQQLEEISESDISTYWPGAQAPVRITPSDTDRQTDEKYRTTTLTYTMQFRIA